jgi:hypothetical protein
MANGQKTITRAAQSELYQRLLFWGENVLDA